jgi:hypothetical protein
MKTRSLLAIAIGLLVWAGVAHDSRACVGGKTPTSVLAVTAHPNPFNPSTTISYTVPSAGRVVIAVHDARGNRIATLIDADHAAGVYTRQWTPGGELASGVYFVRIDHRGAMRMKKVVLLK